MILKRLIVAVVMMLSLLALPAFGVAPSAHAACSTTKFLSFPAWYDGLTDDSCNIKSPGDNISGFIWRIALNILNIMLQLVGYISVGFVMYGGFLYLTSGGDHGRINSGRKTIINALVGMVISFFSVAIVSLIGNNIKG